MLTVWIDERNGNDDDDDVEVDCVDVDDVDDDVEGMRSTIGRPITSPAPHPRTFRIALATNKKVPCLLRRPQKSVNSAGVPWCCWSSSEVEVEREGEGEGQEARSTHYVSSITAGEEAVNKPVNDPPGSDRLQQCDRRGTGRLDANGRVAECCEVGR